jgi:hypothetical protein
MKLVYFVLATLVALPMVSHAEPDNVIRASVGQHMLSGYRLGLLGSYGVMQPSAYENEDNKDTYSGSISALLGFGSGSVSVDAGVNYSRLSTIIESSDASGGSHKLLVNSQYVGVPIVSDGTNSYERRCR